LIPTFEEFYTTDASAPFPKIAMVARGYREMEWVGGDPQS